MTEEALFAEACQLTGSERVAFLDRACPDAVLRARVEALLAADAAASSPIEGTRTFGGPAATGSFRPTAPAENTEGTVIAGRYKLRQPIGEGGMGTVWMADQTEPVKRKVAVKLIRVERGQSKTILARFEAERQAIALMDHPHIAKLLDAGTTDTGAPFFVMELVKGIPLNDFCDQHKLTIPERLNLFTQICGAVQHAHQKGIIHRDLKPGNILVESHDGKPVPKVIDFGLAKATTGLQLSEQSMFTAFGSVMGTPLYMAPEQATFNAVDVDTRADVYALGVILYELLTGTTPLTKETMKKAALDEMLKLIREQEAPTPSSRLSTAESTPSVAANRQIEPQKLGRFVKGELDWIVLKALAKDRDRRYETANGFAKDIERFLNHEPVTAGPPSRSYRLRKFVQRNRPQVIAASLVLLALVAGVVGTTLGLLEAVRQADIAQKNEAEAVRQTKIAMEQAAEKEKQRGIAVSQKKRAMEFQQQAIDTLLAATDEDVEKLLGEKKDLTANEKEYLEAIAKRWQSLARQEGTDEIARSVRALGHLRLGTLWQRLGRSEEAQQEYEQASAILGMLTVEFPADLRYRGNLAHCHTGMGALLRDLGRRVEALDYFRKGLTLREKLASDFPAEHRLRADLAASQSNLGLLLSELGKLVEAEEQQSKSLVLFKNLSAEFPANTRYRSDLAASHNNRGLMLTQLGKHPDAERQFRDSLELRTRLVAEFPSIPRYRSDLATSHTNLGTVLAELGRKAEAEEQYKKGLDLQEKLVSDFPAVPRYRHELSRSHNSLGGLKNEMGKRAEAQEELRKGLELQAKLAVEFPTVSVYKEDLAISYFNLGVMHRDQGQLIDSLMSFEKAIAIVRPAHEADRRAVTAKRLLLLSHRARAQIYRQLEKYPEAAKEYDQVVELSPAEERPKVRSLRALAKLRAGLVNEAVNEVEELRTLPEVDAGQIYNFACFYSLASGKVADKKQEFADTAMVLLKQALQAGYNHARMKKDADLAPLQEREDFKKMLAELEKTIPPKKEVIPPKKEGKK